MKPFTSTLTEYRKWLKDPFTITLMNILDRERRENGLDFTTNVVLTGSVDNIVTQLAKLKGEQQVYELFLTKDALKDQLLDKYIEWQDV